MKKIKNVTINLFLIISEPGDMTLYDYFLYQDYDEYCIMPRKSTFRFPQRLNYWNVKNINEDDLIEMSKKNNAILIR